MYTYTNMHETTINGKRPGKVCGREGGNDMIITSKDKRNYFTYIS